MELKKINSMDEIDWSLAPEWAMQHIFTERGFGFWSDEIELIQNEMGGWQEKDYSMYHLSKDIQSKYCIDTKKIDWRTTLIKRPLVQAKTNLVQTQQEEKQGEVICQANYKYKTASIMHGQRIISYANEILNDDDD